MNASPGARPVLVTGGAGFVGSAVVRALVAAGRRVTVLDNLVNGRREHLADLAGASCTLVVGDVRDEVLAGKLLREHRTVLHLACLGVRHSLHAPVETHAVNATATLVWTRLASEQRCARFVHVSSSEVYGPAQRAPMDEDHPTAPTTVYGASKLAGEAYALAAHRTHGLPVTVVRPFNAFGPRCHHAGDVGEVIPRFVLQAMAGRPLTVFGDGGQTRDFTFVDDTARGIASAAWARGVEGRTFNLASGQDIAIGALAERIAQRAGTTLRVDRGPPRPGDVSRLVGDATRARDALGWSPRVGLDAGLDELIAWYRGSGVDPLAALAKMPARNWSSGTGAPSAAQSSVD